jgi:plasmid replication initiation protein
MTFQNKNNDNKSVEIKKHVNAIHSSNNISLVQRKLFNAFLLNAYHDLPKTSQYEIPVRKLCKLIGYDSNDQKKLKNSILALITTAVEWSVLDQTNEDQSKWRASSIISSARIENGICTYEFSSVMRELLFKPEMYGRIDMNVMSRFKSGYGLALYENCVRFQNLNNTPWLALDVFRKLMGITDNTYPAFCDFKKRVIDIAVREINKFSHLQITPEVQRSNKKVTKIRFLLSKKSTMIHVEHSYSNDTNKLVEILINEFDLSHEVIQDLLGKHEHSYIDDKVALIKNSDSFKQGKIREIGAYLVDAIRRDYKKSKSSKAVMTKVRNEIEESENRAKKALEYNKERYRKHVNDQIDKYLLELSEAEKSKLFADFEKHISSEAYTFQSYKKLGLENVAVRATFIMYMKDKSLNKKTKILSLDEFIATLTPELTPDVCGI